MKFKEYTKLIKVHLNTARNESKKALLGEETLCSVGSGYKSKLTVISSDVSKKDPNAFAFIYLYFI